MALTERQQQIQELLDQGKSVAEVAKKLKITTNGVYQQLRRMRATTGGQSGATPTGTTGRKSGAKKPAAKKASGTRKPAAKPAAQPAATPKPVTASEPRNMTPLQAIKARRDEVTADLKEAEASVTVAQRELDRATAERDKIKSKIEPELLALEAAEKALKGESRPAPIAPAPEPSDTRPADQTPEPPAVEPPADQPGVDPSAADPAPAAPAPAPAEQPAAKPASTAKATTGKKGSGKDNGKGDAAATPKPSNQAEREATADPFEDGEGDIAAKAEAEAAQAAAEAAA